MGIVHSIDWLLEKAEALIAAGDAEAVEYLRRLIEATEESKYLAWGHYQLGLALFRQREVDEARAHFEVAGTIEPDDPAVEYGLGHCDSSQNRRWGALYHFVRAVHQGAGHAEELEFLRAAAVACKRVGLKDAAHRILIGALERNPNHPFVLESLGRFYEEEERWIDAIRVRDDLIEVLKGNDPRQKPRPLSPAVESTPIRPELVQEKVRSINERLRRGFTLVGEEHEVEVPDFELSRTQYPTGLYTLVREFSRRADAQELLETAQVIWARAQHDRFDVHLSNATLAAATHWVTERLHWREVTSPRVLEELYEVAEEQIRAAVRLLVLHFDITLLPVEGALAELGRETEEFRTLLRAILLGVAESDVAPSRLLL